jgi:basic membrane protein A
VKKSLIVLGITASLLSAGGSHASAAKEYRVAFVGDAGGVEAPIMRQALTGLRRATRTLGVEVRVVVQPIRTSWTSTFEELARQGYDLVIAPFQHQAPAVLAAAEAYPTQRFVIGDALAADYGTPWPPNVLGLSAREEEIGFVVGYLAGLVERRRPGPAVAGSVAGWDVGSVVRFVAGFRAGARRASPGIRLLHTYSYNFWDADRCRRIAADQIARGARVVFNVAGKCGLGTLAAARERGVWGIGVDQDQSRLGPHVLTSAVKDVGLMTYAPIALLVEGRLETGKDTTLGLREGALRLGRVSPRVPPDIVRATRRIERAIVSGRLTDIPTTFGDP